ncbi:FtsH protease activity modulator HflK [Candidatus Berkiella aquae]|uniref:Protein HflK n=1 Tax=Candidatus Berkiella aquae TaxID=295108 RepID=A0A0Q9YIZ7_9GAMM|nr:FtsH protease activity modulator HflK [Candidatus Berkiella aquae]MCS5710180.1 FtsH protease activity modulator HflK [Candidatus Berkiella aquae]
MSWNESGGDDKGKKKDPWGNNEAGPPNIDEALKQLQRKLRGLFGGQETPSGTGGTTGFKGNASGQGSGKTLSFGLIAIALAIVYVISGIYIVGPAEEAVVLRLGRYVTTEKPGPHWIAPFIETREIVNVQEVKTIERGGPMLTKDENIVNANIAVQYRINNPKEFLFNIVNPETSLKQVADSALRAVVAQSTLNEVLTSGRSEIGAEISKQVQQMLNNYKAGIEVSDLAMQQTKAPDAVKPAFDDAIKAQQDEERLVNEAQAYAHKIIPIAEGRAIRTVEEAKAYKQQVILGAEGRTEKFAKLLPEYQRAPKVTRERMYLDTLQEVYSTTPKILIDVNGGNNLVYLPLDKIMQQSRPAPVETSATKDEEENAAANAERNNQGMAAQRRIEERTGYDDIERPRGGA